MHEQPETNQDKGKMEKRKLNIKGKGKECEMKDNEMKIRKFTWSEHLL